MKNTLNMVEMVNRILINTLNYKEGLQELSKISSDEETKKKLTDLAKEAKEESERLIKAVSDLGGKVDSTERKTDEQKYIWIPKPLPNADDKEELFQYLIKAERKKEEDYNKVLAHEDADREMKNYMDRPRKKAEENIVYFQSASKS